MGSPSSKPIKRIIIKDGNIRSSIQLLLVGVGWGGAYFGSEISFWLGIIGLCIAAIGGYSGLAGSVGVKPFKDKSPRL